jgi:hypothetical protein
MLIKMRINKQYENMLARTGVIRPLAHAFLFWLRVNVARIGVAENPIFIWLKVNSANIGVVKSGILFGSGL